MIGIYITELHYNWTANNQKVTPKMADMEVFGSQILRTS